MAKKIKKVFFTLVDGDTGVKKKAVFVLENGTAIFHVDGYNSGGEVLALQIYNGELKALAWTDSEDDTPTTFDLEGARTEAGKVGLDEDGSRCPYCYGRNTAELDDHNECHDCGRLFASKAKAKNPKSKPYDEEELITERIAELRDDPEYEDLGPQEIYRIARNQIRSEMAE